jgi:hypothetical protein
MKEELDGDDESVASSKDSSVRTLVIQKTIEGASWLLSRLLLAVTLVVLSFYFEVPIREMLKGEVVSKLQQKEDERLSGQYELLVKIEDAIVACETRFLKAYRSVDHLLEIKSTPVVVGEVQAAISDLGREQSRLEELFTGRTVRMSDRAEASVYDLLSFIKHSVVSLREASRDPRSPNVRPRMWALKAKMDGDAFETRIHLGNSRYALMHKKNSPFNRVTSEP